MRARALLSPAAENDFVPVIQPDRPRVVSDNAAAQRTNGEMGNHGCGARALFVLCDFFLFCFFLRTGQANIHHVLDAISIAMQRRVKILIGVFAKQEVR